MRRIRSKDTSIELALRRELWKRGIRYRKNVQDLPGKPDIVFKKAKVAVFCDSEFWHGYDWDSRKDKIGTHREYWIPKIERNIQRDREVDADLENLGYEVLRFWGKDILADPSACADKVQTAIEKRKRARFRAGSEDPRGLSCPVEPVHQGQKVRSVR